jgi:hypothetical protein
MCSDKQLEKISLFVESALLPSVISQTNRTFWLGRDTLESSVLLPSFIGINVTVHTALHLLRDAQFIAVRPKGRQVTGL